MVLLALLVNQTRTKVRLQKSKNIFCQNKKAFKSFFALLSINQSLQLSYNWCCSGYANLHACSSWHDTDGSELNIERLSVDGGFRKKFWVSLVSSVPSLRPETFLPPNTACQHLNLICANEVNPQLFSHSRDGAARSQSSILRLRAGLRNTFLWPKTMWLLFSNLIREASWPSSELTQNGGTMWDGSFYPARLSVTIWHLDREFVVETLNHHLPSPVCCCCWHSDHQHTDFKPFWVDVEHLGLPLSSPHVPAATKYLQPL